MKRLMIGAAGLALSLSTHAALVDLTGKGYVTYGDFNSYSLPIAGLDVNSTPGQIQDFVVIATGSSGQGVNTNFAGMDNAYATPSGVSGSNYFSTGGETDPDQVADFTGDADATWDTSLAALETYLDGESMVFYFNNNNLNGANEQSLAAWAQVTIYDNTGGIVDIFDFTNDGGAYALVSEGGGGTFMGDPSDYTSDGSGPMVGNNDSTDYVLSGGPICVDTDGAIPIPVSCGTEAADEGPINHNLGADEAAYAIVSPELNALLEGLFGSGSDLSDYTMSVDLRLGCDPAFGMADDEICTGAESGFGKNINNGYEQLFIATAVLDEPMDIPEPGVLFLLGSGLLFLRWRSK